jgi:hypothetical protein
MSTASKGQRKARFRLGQVVFDKIDSRPRKLKIRRLYPNGWYYGDVGQNPTLPEDWLRPLTRREAGQPRKGRE